MTIFGTDLWASGLCIVVTLLYMVTPVVFYDRSLRAGLAAWAVLTGFGALGLWGLWT